MATPLRSKPAVKPRSAKPLARRPDPRAKATGRSSAPASARVKPRKKAAPPLIQALQLPAPSAATITLTPAQRSALRARAHTLSAVVQLGQAGLTEAVLLEMERALRAHELIKISAPLTAREARATLLATLCTRLQAAAVQQIGKTLVLYRPR